MKRFDQWWFPDGETQLIAEMAKHNVRVDGRLTWQYHKYEAALSLLALDRRRVAVDVGAHIGLWSYWMARDFGFVHAFEPNGPAASCWLGNMGSWLPDNEMRPRFQLYPVALGDRTAGVSLVQPEGKSGGAHLDKLYGGPIDQRTLDSFDLPIVDLLKIDVEGYETAVIDGARDTLQRCKPIVIVEEALWSRYGYDGPPSIDLLQLGMKFRTALGPDKIYEW